MKKPRDEMKLNLKIFKMAYIDETIHSMNAKELLNAALISIYCDGENH